MREQNESALDKVLEAYTSLATRPGAPVVASSLLAQYAGEELQSLRAQLGAAEAEKWIPVSERLPNEVACLITWMWQGEPEIAVATWGGSTDTWVNEEGAIFPNVVAWRPLPAPYVPASPPPPGGR